LLAETTGPAMVKGAVEFTAIEPLAWAFSSVAVVKLWTSIWPGGRNRAN
jgi:hypothetical protein